MNQREKSFLLWILWVICVAAILAFFFHSIVQGAPRKTRYATQGSGAADLIAPYTLVSQGPTTMPKLVINPKWNTYKFSVSTSFGSNDCGPAPELWWTNSDMKTSVVLAWYNPLIECNGTNKLKYAPTNTVTVWRLRLWTNILTAGTSSTLEVPLVAPGPSNRVVIITSKNATNLQYCSYWGNAWTLYGATNYIETNPATRFWRGLGSSRSKPPVLFSSNYWQ